jgi:hypothetical protein
LGLLRLCADHDDRDARTVSGEDACEIPAGNNHSANGWKVEVKNGDIVIGLLDLPDCLLAIRSRLDAIAFTEKHFPEAFAAVAIVIHHQYSFCFLLFYRFTHSWLSG